MNIFGGYLHIIGSVHWTIFSSVFTCILFSSFISREFENRTLQLLLAQPVSRTRVIFEKYAAGIFYLIIISIFGFLGFYLGTYHGVINVPYKMYHFVFAVSNGFAFFLSLSSFSLFFSVIFNEYKKSAVASLTFFFLSYLTFFLGAFSPRWATIKKYTLFRFFDTEKLFMTSDFQWGNILSLIIITIIVTGISIYIFKKKSVNS
jgi:ABC-2 type transport system permease protein